MKTVFLDCLNCFDLKTKSSPQPTIIMDLQSKTNKHHHQRILLYNLFSIWKDKRHEKLDFSKVILREKWNLKFNCQHQTEYPQKLFLEIFNSICYIKMSSKFKKNCLLRNFRCCALP